VWGKSRVFCGSGKATECRPCKREDAWPEIVTNEWRWRRLAWRMMTDRDEAVLGSKVLTPDRGSDGLGGSGRGGDERVRYCT